MRKSIVRILEQPSQHWVGDGFPVRSVLTPKPDRNMLGPFILMDYAGPHTFEPAGEPRGVDTHPHKGFETVTVVFQGEVEHRDSAGNSGSIGPGDVQWMTAASGILHEEKHSRRFTETGGTLEMAQLWVNLPAQYKSEPPGYQTILANEIPVVPLANGSVRLIAGDFGAVAGAARTFTPVTLWVVSLTESGLVDLPIGAGQEIGVYVRSGQISIEAAVATEGQLVWMGEYGEWIHLQADGPAELLILGGQPIREPMVAYGPFVMNTKEEIAEAIRDFQTGKFGTL